MRISFALQVARITRNSKTCANICAGLRIPCNSASEVLLFKERISLFILAHYSTESIYQ